MMHVPFSAVSDLEDTLVRCHLSSEILLMVVRLIFETSRPHGAELTADETAALSQAAFDAADAARKHRDAYYVLTKAVHSDGRAAA